MSREKTRPVYELRIGLIRVSIWANQTDNGTRHKRHGKSPVQGRRPVEGFNQLRPRPTCSFSPSCWTRRTRGIYRKNQEEEQDG